MIRASWLFYFSKYIELLDTVGALLKKKKKCVLKTFCVFLLNINRILVCVFMLGILCAEEKTRPDYISACVPSLLHALDLVVGHHLDSW